MPLDDVLGDRQPETSAGATASPIAPIEPFEDPLSLARRDARPVVADADADVPAVRQHGRFHADRRAGGGESPGIVQQVDQRAHDVTAIRKDGPRRRDIDRDGHSALCHEPRHRGAGGGGEVRQRLRHEPKQGAAGVQLVQPKEVVGEVAHAPDLIRHLGQQRPRDGLHARRKVVEEQAERRQGRAQIVRDIRDQIAARAFEVLEERPIRERDDRLAAVQYERPHGVQAIGDVHRLALGVAAMGVIDDRPQLGGADRRHEGWPRLGRD
ncbi:MAG: hypothetical protein ABI780_02250 [Ardenticatenales bacterium]